MVLLIVGLTSRIFMRIPPGTVGLVARAGRHQGVREAGVNRVNPFLALTHVVTTRELAFDVPVAAVRSADGVNVNVDLVLTLGIGDPVKLVYSITTRDIDQFIHATTPGRRPHDDPRDRGALGARPRREGGGDPAGRRSTTSSRPTASTSARSRSRASCCPMP